MVSPCHLVVILFVLLVKERQIHSLCYYITERFCTTGCYEKKISINSCVIWLRMEQMRAELAMLGESKSNISFSLCQTRINLRKKNCLLCDKK